MIKITVVIIVVFRKLNKKILFQWMMSLQMTILLSKMSSCMVMFLKMLMQG
ncbi:hypothetical protein HPP92_014255 [Vanilla planifolia]|uniref:Uncharacterized protein n=1 Tax=Vanilla planifolia TaxID=51239 RepID=A0A835QR75_VANPL|nr:hypothetical protein HPP92_014255 [Vanilla planifolia]